MFYIISLYFLMSILLGCLGFLSYKFAVSIIVLDFVSLLSKLLCFILIVVVLPCSTSDFPSNLLYLERKTLWNQALISFGSVNWSYFTWYLTIIDGWVTYFSCKSLQKFSFYFRAVVKLEIMSLSPFIISASCRFI
jgi:hypothetical protein